MEKNCNYLHYAKHEFVLSHIVELSKRSLEPRIFYDNDYNRTPTVSGVLIIRSILHLPNWWSRERIQISFDRGVHTASSKLCRLRRRIFFVHTATPSGSIVIQSLLFAFFSQQDASHYDKESLKSKIFYISKVKRKIIKNVFLWYYVYATVNSFFFNSDST